MMTWLNKSEATLIAILQLLKIQIAIGFNEVNGEGEWVAVSSFIMERILHNLSQKRGEGEKQENIQWIIEEIFNDNNNNNNNL